VKHNSDKILLGLVAVLAVILILVVYPTLEQRVVNAGDSAPEFKVVTDHGKTITRSSFGGKLLVLNFWATWCAPCIAEIPSLDAFQKQFRSQGVVVLGVSIDKNEQLYHRFLERFRVGFETSRDPEANLAADYGTFQFPESYIIDSNGKVVEKIISDQNWMDPQFVAHIKKML
jgi:cytochrome c biogenesis protein CcmG/thiol:disulfide interchange protein DsbE